MREKFALVVGSSSGLGFEISHYLLDDGYYVFGVSRSGTNINHGYFIDIMTDIKEEELVEDALNTVGDVTQGLDLIINCAGVLNMAPINETSSHEFQEHFETNVVGAFHILKHIDRFLREGMTHIVHLSSLATKTIQENIAAYSASKAALNILIETCKEEWKEKKVRFSTLSPGAINSDLWDKVEEDIIRDDMMSVDDFMYVFDMLIKSPSSISFSEVIFSKTMLGRSYET